MSEPNLCSDQESPADEGNRLQVSSTIENRAKMMHLARLNSTSDDNREEDDDFCIVIEDDFELVFPKEPACQEGYLNDFLDILDAHQHPCIVLGLWALAWMGTQVIQRYPIWFLLRAEQFEGIILDLLSTSRWEEVPPGPAEIEEDHLKPTPRVFRRLLDDVTIKFFSEEAAHLLVDPSPSDNDSSIPSKIEVPDCWAWNPILVEKDMLPAVLLARKPKPPRILPETLCQSPNRQPQTKLYVSSIPRYLEALIAQHQLRRQRQLGLEILTPKTEIEMLVRYLFLDTQKQREKVLGMVGNKTREPLKEILVSYKRTMNFHTHEVVGLINQADSLTEATITVDRGATAVLQTGEEAKVII